VGLTQAELARRVRIRPENLHTIETHKREPSVGTLLRLAIALHCTLDDLVEIEDDSPESRFLWRCGDLRVVTPGQTETEGE
jgi:DNA-binding Xre family transcriptional regulator